MGIFMFFVADWRAYWDSFAEVQSLSKNHNLYFFGFFLGQPTLRDRKHVSVIILVNCSVAR